MLIDNSIEAPLIFPLCLLLSEQTFIDLFTLSARVCDSTIVVVIIAPATSCLGALAPAADDEYVTFDATPVSGKPNSRVGIQITQV